MKIPTKAKPVVAGPLARVREHMAAHPKAPVGVPELLLALPYLTHAQATNALNRLRAAGKIEKVGKSQASVHAATYLLKRPPPPTPAPGLALGCSTAQPRGISKMSGTYTPPRWDSARTDADNHLTIESKGA